MFCRPFHLIVIINFSYMTTVIVLIFVVCSLSFSCSPLLIYYIIAVLLFFPLNKWFPFSLVFISFHFSPQYLPLDFFSAPIVAHYFFVFVLYCKTDCHLLASRLEKNE